MKLKKLIAYLRLHIAVHRIRAMSNIKTEEMTGTKIKKFLTELGLNIDARVYDRKYALTTWKNWDEIITNDVVKTMGYIKEFHDCDNFAFGFATMAAMLYGLTSAPPTYGDTNYGRHYFNIIVTKDNGKLNAHLYEAITGKSVKIRKGEDLEIGTMTYEPISITLF